MWTDRSWLWPQREVRSSVEETQREESIRIPDKPDKPSIAQEGRAKFSVVSVTVICLPVPSPKNLCLTSMTQSRLQVKAEENRSFYQEGNHAHSDLMSSLSSSVYVYTQRIEQ